MEVVGEREVRWGREEVRPIEGALMSRTLLGPPEAEPCEASAARGGREELREEELLGASVRAARRH